MTEEELTTCYRVALSPNDRNAAAVLKDLARSYHVLTTTMSPPEERDNPLRLAFREGQRSVVLYIFSRLGIGLDIARQPE